MKRIIKIFCIVIVLCAFLAQDSHAFWGKKKSTKKSEPKETEQKAAKKAKPVENQEKQTQQAPKQEAAKEEPEPEKSEQPAKQEPDEETQEKIKKQRLAKQKKRQQLSNTKWEIELNSVQNKGKPAKDSLIFEENRFYSEVSEKDGFSATNYSLTIQDDGITIWETMQTASEGRVNFWRGEITEDMQVMKGIISKRSSEGKTENFGFNSLEKKVIKK